MSIKKKTLLRMVFFVGPVEVT